jgi:glutathione synthase
VTAKYLITANSLNTFQPKFDSTIRIAAELLKRNIQVYYFDTDSINPSKLSDSEMNKLPVRAILKSDPNATPFFELSQLEQLPANYFNVFIHRRDPPVDSVFKLWSKFFSLAPKNILQINDPIAISKFSEHELPREFPKFSTPTFPCQSFEDLELALPKLGQEFVLKPHNQSSGVGIEFFKNTTPRSELKSYFDKWNPVVAQPFIKEIETLGDLRIAVVNCKVIGSVTRIPKPGSRLGNLHAGASAKRLDPTKHQIEVSMSVANELAKKGLHFLGLDFIGPYLNEINITSPSAIVQINEVMGFDHFPILIDEFENLRKDFSKC